MSSNLNISYDIFYYHLQILSHENLFSTTEIRHVESTPFVCVKSMAENELKIVRFIAFLTQMGHTPISP